MNSTITISIANFKGGVGKTTSSINVGACLAIKGKKTLLVDLDPQYNLTQSLGINDPQESVYDALMGKSNLPILSIKDNLDLVPSSLELSKAEFEMASIFKREFVLSTLLEEVKDKYDFIIIDCPPALGVLTINSFVASEYIIIPVEAEYLSLKGYSILSEAISKIGLEIDKVFITKYDSRKVLNRDVLESIKNSLGNKVFNTLIRDNISLAEAPTSGLDIFSYEPNCNGAIDYESLTNEIIQLLN
ncbi:ParA family protein [Plebeiibacterium sediminum]|uniref:ParA family protein n=1 Tax=Plebeiibacterium sediminum TaxID=2992112 RepID=A0AAE3SIN5_9BACT|nr:ParA family protein [Plebeiobacterium sediminum]MCW3789408.1 ParA family protein [Plebeiobacterium sediminum]